MAGIQPIQSIGAARPYPLQIVAGETGVGAAWSQGQPLDPQKLGIIAKSRAIKPEFQQESYPAPYDFDSDQEYILPGSKLNPDQTPRTHAAPFAGWAGNYNDGDSMSVLNENIMEIHSEDFGSLDKRVYSAKWATANDSLDLNYNSSIGENELQPLTGQVRRNGGYDATQGYGGGGKGPGGINRAPTGKGKTTRFTNPQPTYSLLPSERPLTVPQGGLNAAFTDAVQGPQNVSYGWGWGDGASPYNNASAYSPQPEAPSFQGQYTEGPISGW